MEYNKKTFSIAITLILLVGIAIGYIIGSSSAPGSKNANIGSNAPRQKNGDLPLQREYAQNFLSAEEAFALADQNALSWSKDSYISEISLFSKEFTGEGKSTGWKFVYYSKTKDKLYEVAVKDGESREGEEKEASKAPQTLKGPFVDSPIVAKTFFSNNPQNTEITSVRMYFDEGTKKFIWTISFPKGNHTIDAEI